MMSRRSPAKRKVSPQTRVPGERKFARLGYGIEKCLRAVLDVDRFVSGHCSPLSPDAAAPVKRPPEGGQVVRCDSPLAGDGAGHLNLSFARGHVLHSLHGSRASRF